MASNCVSNPVGLAGDEEDSTSGVSLLIEDEPTIFVSINLGSLTTLFLFSASTTELRFSDELGEE
jgi:hypothetical protein